MKKIPATIFAIILFPALATADNIITGTVEDESGNSLQHANISIQENSGGTTTLEKEKQQINQNRIAELRKNLQKTKDVETSDANKLISASGMGVTGAGAMMAASALAEQNADADAELDMTAYLATFTCDYGIGRNIRGGETNVELPGGNNLISLRQNYISLATDLRERKTVLNMAPGIESEEIYDSATGGLYDNASVGKTSGAFTSLARALTDETSADAIAWVSQKEETAEKLKSGLVTAGIGAAGSLTANLIWNRNSYNENSDAINAEYDAQLAKILQEFEERVNNLTPSTTKCPDNVTGIYPNCKCNDIINEGYFNPKTSKCEKCPGDTIIQDGECRCPADKPFLNQNDNKCYANRQKCEPNCTPSTPHIKIDPNTCNCTCIDGYDYDNNDKTCKCESPKSEIDGLCYETPSLTNTTVVLDDKVLFEIGKSDLTDAAKQAIKNFLTNLTKANYTACSFDIKGYSDPIGSEKSNEKLSQKRAEAVKSYIEEQNLTISPINATGLGEKKCYCDTTKIPVDKENDDDYKACTKENNIQTLTGDVRFAPCRRIEISIKCDN